MISPFTQILLQARKSIVFIYVLHIFLDCTSPEALASPKQTKLGTDLHLTVARIRSRAEPNRGERPAWVERCAVAARNPEDHRILSNFFSSNQVIKDERVRAG